MNNNKQKIGEKEKEASQTTMPEFLAKLKWALGGIKRRVRSQVKPFSNGV